MTGQTDTTDVMEWLASVRRLSADLLAEMGVKAVQHPSLGPAAAFQYFRPGEPKSYAAKFRTIGKQFRSTEGVTRGLYNEVALKLGSALPVVITEGEMDALSCVQAGFDRSVSVPDGWTEDGGKRQCLIDAEALLRDSPFVIVAGDDDAAGRSLPRAVANILRGHDVRRAVWPEGCKDANDVLMRHGEGELARCLNAALRVDPPGGIITGISDMPPLPPRRVLRTGIGVLDEVMAFEIGAMSVGTGTPGSGKSTLSTFAAYHVAMHEKIRVGFMAFETHPHRLRDHLCRLYARRPWDDLPEAEQARAGQRLDPSFRILHRTYEDIPQGHNLGWLEEEVYTLAVRDWCKLIVIDPWNELEHLPEPGESMTSYINFALQRIRTWAERYECHICLIAHPRKMLTEGKPRSPTGYDIADSAAFANKPALGWAVHQDKDDAGDPFVRVTAWKVRDVQLYGFEKRSRRLTFDAQAMSYQRHMMPAPAGEYDR
jgi:twinkle protein